MSYVNFFGIISRPTKIGTMWEAYEAHSAVSAYLCKDGDMGVECDV